MFETHILMLRACAALALCRYEEARGRRLRDERGEIAQTVILVAIFAAAAIVIGGIIVAKMTSKANSIATE